MIPVFAWKVRNQDYMPMRCNRCGHVSFFHDDGRTGEVWRMCENCKVRRRFR